MAVNYNASAVNRGLLLSCDFANPQNYSKSQENLFTYSEQFDQGVWSKNNTNAVLVNEVGPFSSSLVYQVANTPSALSYFGQANTLSNSATYTASIYVKPLYGIKTIAFEIFGVGFQTFYLDTLLTATSGGSAINTIQVLSNGWYRISSTFTTPSSGACTFNVFYLTAYGSTSVQSMFLVSGAQLEKSSSVGAYVKTTSSAIVSNTISDKISGLTGTLNNNGYYYYDSASKSIQFDRNATTVTGGYAEFIGTGNLTSTNFLYNDHTMEIFVKINDYAASNINAFENGNSLFNYQGYHAGFWYQPGAIYYQLWSNTNNVVTAPLWTVPIINVPAAGTWFHLVATRSGDITSIYINGSLVVSSSYAISGNPGTSSFIRVGAGNLTQIANYIKANVSIARMYNVALTASEVLQNFNTYRGRGGI